MATGVPKLKTLLGTQRVNAPWHAIVSRRCELSSGVVFHSISGLWVLINYQDGFQLFGFLRSRVREKDNYGVRPLEKLRKQKRARCCELFVVRKIEGEIEPFCCFCRLSPTSRPLFAVTFSESLTCSPQIMTTSSRIAQTNQYCESRNVHSTTTRYLLIDHAYAESPTEFSWPGHIFTWLWRIIPLPFASRFSVDNFFARSEEYTNTTFFSVFLQICPHDCLLIQLLQ